MYPQPAQGQQFQPMQQPAQPVDREIQGVITNIEQRNGGYFRFHITEPGKQYPVKVDTKRPETIQQAMSLRGQAVAAQIREQESDKINPNNGRPYINRYLNAIAPAGFSPGVQPQPGAVGPQGQVYQPQPSVQQVPGTAGAGGMQYQPVQPQPQQQWPQVTHSEPVPQIQPGIMGFEKDINIMRQTAAKVVAMSFEHLPPDQRTIVGMIEACETWLAYFVHGPLRFGVTPFDGSNQPTTGQLRGAPQQHNIPPQHDTVGNPPQYGGQQPEEYVPQGAMQTDIFGAPMDGQGNPISGDPGREQGDPGPGY